MDLHVTIVFEGPEKARYTNYKQQSHAGVGAGNRYAYSCVSLKISQVLKDKIKHNASCNIFLCSAYLTEFSIIVNGNATKIKQFIIKNKLINNKQGDKK